MRTIHNAPPLASLQNRDGAVRLLPLVLAAIWACTALSVEFSSPRVDNQIWRIGFADLFANVALYVPLGIALRRRGVVCAIATAAVVSVTVEVIQIFYPDRYTAVTDVAGNVGGALLGWYLSNRFDRGSAWGLDPISLTARLRVLAFCLYVTAAVVLSFPGPSSDFSNWDPDCRVIIADELTRDRPWKGQIEGAAVFDQCLRSGEIDRLSRLGAGSAIETAIPAMSPLLFIRRPAALDSVRGVPLIGASENQRFFDALVASGKLTLVVWFRTRSESQRGPARIVGFSKSPLSQNFSLGQEGRQIIFRLRTPTTVSGGYYPQTETRAILEEDKPAFVAATYDGRTVRVYIDGGLETRMNLRAHGRPLPFFCDNGLPASAVFLGLLMGVVWVGAAWTMMSNSRLWGAFGGLIGGVVFVLLGGADALPEFTPWVPVLAAWGGVVVGCAASEDSPRAGRATD